MPTNNEKNRQTAQGFTPQGKIPSAPDPENKIQVNEQTLTNAKMVYTNRQNAISHSLGGFLEHTVDEVKTGVKEQVRDGFGAMAEAAVIAFVEETVAMDAAGHVGAITAPKYQFKSLSSRKSLSQINSLLPGSTDQPQLTEG